MSDPSSSRSEKRQQRPWLRLAGAGMELAVISLSGGAIGWLADRQAGLAKPYFSALGGLVGFAFGMFRLLRLAIELNRGVTIVEHSRGD